jgi:hypothetical protein
MRDLFLVISGDPLLSESISDAELCDGDGNLEFMANRRNSNCDLPLLTDDGDIEDIIEEFPLLTDDAIAGGDLPLLTEGDAPFTGDNDLPLPKFKGDINKLLSLDTDSVSL